MTIKHIPEEKLVDYLLGNLEQSEEEMVKNHLLHCVECYRNLHQWQIILSEAERVPPSKHLKERIWNSIIKRRMKKKRTWPLPVISLAAMLCLFIGISLMIAKVKNTVPVAVNDQIRAEQLQQNPHTKQLNIVPASAYYNSINGNIWINDQTKELFLEVNGLRQLTNQDYQVWIIYTDDEIHGALLTIENGASRLFIQNENVPDLKMLKASIEPKGGSIVQTGPDTFFVEIDE